MRIWQKNPKFKGGKYLVVRRDGTVPAWPKFVLGGRDPYAPVALRAYAAAFDTAHAGVPVIEDRAYSDSVRELADDFERYAATAGEGDPSGAPHRTDQPEVVAAMVGQDATIVVRHEADQPRDLCTTRGQPWRTVRNANEQQDREDLALEVMRKVFDTLRPLSQSARDRVLKALGILLEGVG